MRVENWCHLTLYLKGPILNDNSITIWARDKIQTGECELCRHIWSIIAAQGIHKVLLSEHGQKKSALPSCYHVHFKSLYFSTSIRKFKWVLCDEKLFFSFYSQNNKIVCQACINLGQFKQLFDSKIVKSIGITSLSQPFFDVAIFWEQFCKTHFCCLIWLTTVDSISSKYTSWVFDVLEQEAKDFTFCFYSFI